jgi:hypothetical protein
MAKVYDVVVKTGSYQKDGEMKNRYENIGVVMDNGDGPFMLLKRTFNPAGVPDLKGDNSDMLLVSMFAPQEQNQQQNQQPQQHQGQGFQQQPPRGQHMKQPQQQQQPGYNGGNNNEPSF